MEKATTFHGIGKQSEDSPDEGNDVGTIGEEWATDKPVEGKSPRKGGLVMRGRGTTNTLPVQQPEQKLVLSDDDIEDD
jgi:cell cycle checkpoint protein